MAEQDRSSEYLSQFGEPSNDSGKYHKDSRLAKAYEVALDIRKFEIELYWKRSASFWLFVAAIATAITLIASGKVDLNGLFSQEAQIVICTAISMAGCTVCFSWFLINKSSKFWQRNWEYQVDILEKNILGPLYRTVFSKINSGHMHSVTEINSEIPRYLGISFLTAAIVFLLSHPRPIQLIACLAVISANFLFMRFIERQSLTSQAGKSIETGIIDFFLAPAFYFIPSLEEKVKPFSSEKKNNDLQNFDSNSAAAKERKNLDLQVTGTVRKVSIESFTDPQQILSRKPLE
ncbi:RipA family octameric membrane protein [Burkholderia sp. Ac-20379]|uniref:RipA family octameric membrane protein n=1 Tax=Burkholderia sp. Ac-20379 TaxID=2703900 RepID=UPI00198252AD|nr:hypothetical protein [Burkholderia sp. Ac-20379]MBN3722628.1 hypothetical protein [Burkholderia sp. Ac-20379]